MHPPDRHCEQKTAGREQTHYLFSRNLWAGVAHRGQESRLSCTLPHLPHAVPFASLVHILPVFISVTSLSASLVFPISSLPPLLS